MKTAMKVETTISVRCTRCEIIIEKVRIDSMIYCVVCRKWCREIEEDDEPARCETSEKIRDGHCC